MRLRVTVRGEALFDEWGLEDQVLLKFKAFLREHPELLPLTCRAETHYHPSGGS